MPALAAAALALGAAGCGLDTSEDVVGSREVAAVRSGTTPGVASLPVEEQQAAPVSATGVSAAPAAAPPPLDRAAPLAPAADPVAPATPPRLLHAPTVLGVPAAAAALRLGASGFRTEYGRRYDVVRQSWRTAVLRADHRADRPVTTQSPTRPEVARLGQVVATGTTPSPVPDGRRPRLVTVRWGTARFSGGVLELGRLGRLGSCDRVDHVQLGPRGDRTRTIRVWVVAPADPPRGGCVRRQPQRLRLRPGPGWDRDTVAVDVVADRR